MTEIHPESPDSIFYQVLKQVPTEELSVLLIALRDCYNLVLWLAEEKVPEKNMYATNITLLGMLLNALPNSQMATYENAREVLVSCPPDWTKIAVVVFEDRDVALATSEIIDRLVTLGARPFELPTLQRSSYQIIRRFAALGL